MYTYRVALSTLAIVKYPSLKVYLEVVVKALDLNDASHESILGR